MDQKAGEEGLDGLHGRRLWRSLEELEGGEAFRQLLAREFPGVDPEHLDPVSRRNFLRLMGASLALAGVGGCAYNAPESIVPYVQAPERTVPGRPKFYATAVPLGGYGTGVLVESHTGRPTKIEGNALHPASLGGTDPFVQSAVLSLYDPDRSRVVTFNGRISTWEDFLAALMRLRTEKRASRGQGLRILTETVTSPTLAGQIGNLLGQFPRAKWHIHDPVGRSASRGGALLAFGEDVAPLPHIDRADVIVSIDADFLGWGPGRLADARAFAHRREADVGSGRMNRLHAAESSPGLTGAMADHRLGVPSGKVAALARELARGLGLEGIPDSVALEPAARAWVDRAVADLRAHRGSSLVLAGECQRAEVHALAHAINDTLTNVGKSVEYLPSAESGPAEPGGSLSELLREADAGEVDLLVILGGNPAYDAPADLDFAGRVAKIGMRIHLGQYEDETAALCQWHVAEAHFLETWGDVRAYDGTATIQQPLIEPLYGGHSALDLVSALAGQAGRNAMEIVREYWKGQDLPGDFERAWRKALHDGLVAGTASKPRPVKLKPLGEILAGAGVVTAGGDASPAGHPLELLFRPDPTIWDGRFSNNGWLQELPKPLTRLTWDNAAMVSPAAAQRLGLANEDMVELNYRGRSLTFPIWIQPGHPDGSITVHLGYGRTRAGQIGTGAGFNAYALRTSDAPWGGPGLSLRKTGTTYRLAATQHHHTMEGRDLVRAAPLATYLKHPEFARGDQSHHEEGLSLFEEPAPQRVREGGEGNAWGMAINLNTCIGCGACVAACQAENNIPIVGKEQVLASREMHWIRVDRYYEGEADDPDPATYFQPLPCMHCEKAPCELVCPVAATSHSAEGLNEMTYNRCVGTRYCSNNCPYKVRRFNFLQYSDDDTESLKFQRNPDVTVRSRGVMEKCTYCVQRISAARIAAESEGRTMVRSGEVMTACQAACPTRAIVFGNLNDAESEVVKLKASPRNYALLAELNTQPRTTYLAKLTNPGAVTEPGTGTAE